MDMSNILMNGEWADWPKPSPTSPHNINIRFYTVVEDDGAALRFDIGAVNEAALEAIFDALLKQGNRPKLSTAVDFEHFLRTMFQTRLENLTPYTLVMTQYAVLTADTNEVRRSLQTERRTLTRALNLLPYRMLADLRTEETAVPQSWWGRLLFHLRHVLTWARVSIPFG